MRFSSVEAWLAWQESLSPREIDLGLERVQRVFSRLFPDGVSFRSIVVAGTNGKGSTTCYAASLLQAHGLRTGRYLSPHILHYRERIAVDDTEIPDEALCEAFAAVDDMRGDVSLTYFEFGTLAALWYFQRQVVDVAVLEVGLGGRLDAVNVIDADVAVVTSIGMDHMDWLGHDIDSIAREKAGIFRRRRPAVYGSHEMPAEIRRAATALEAGLQCLGEEFSIDNADGHCRYRSRETDLVLPEPAMSGKHQLENLATALTAVKALGIELDVQKVDDAVRRAKLPGRLQVLRANPELMVDVAHNAAAAMRVAEWLAAHPKPTRLVLAMLADKDPVAVVEVLREQVSHWYLAGSSGPRGQSVAQLAMRLDSLQLPARQYADVRSAIDAALDDAGNDERVLVLGSFLTVSEALAYKV